jgi:hypothetical protein
VADISIVFIAAILDCLTDNFMVSAMFRCAGTDG